MRTEKSRRKRNIKWGQKKEKGISLCIIPEKKSENERKRDRSRHRPKNKQTNIRTCSYADRQIGRNKERKVEKVKGGKLRL